MKEFADRDVKAVLDAVGDLQGAEDLEQFRSGIVGVLDQVVEADYVSYNEVVGGTTAGITISRPVLPSWAHAAWARYAHENPLLVHHAGTRDPRAYRFSDFVTQEELHALDLYRELYRPLGVEHQIAFTLPSDPDRTIGIVLSRGDPDFSDRERDLLDLLRPHLVQAYREAAERERTARLLSALRDGLDDTGALLVILDSRRRIAFASTQATAALREFTSGPLGTDQLPDEIVSWLESRDGDEAPLLLGPADRPLLVRALKAESPGHAEILHLERRSRGLGLTSLRGLGLTQREAEVLQCISRGQGTDPIAALLGISPRTVHKHVERVLSKLGARDRLEAVAIARAAVGHGDEARP